jgi:hypothetical protein
LRKVWEQRRKPLSRMKLHKDPKIGKRKLRTGRCPDRTVGTPKSEFLL